MSDIYDQTHVGMEGVVWHMTLYSHKGEPHLVGILNKVTWSKMSKPSSGNLRNWTKIVLSSILVHEGHLYFHLWPGSISNEGKNGLIKGSRCFYFTRVLSYIFGSLGMSGSYSKLAKDQGTETSTIKPLKIMINIFDSGHKWKELQAVYKWDQCKAYFSVYFY